MAQIRINNTGSKVTINKPATPGSVAITVPQPTPSTLSYLLLNVTHGSGVDLSWQSVGEASSYSVQRSTDGVNYSEIGTSSGTSYTDNTAALNTDYYYKVVSGSVTSNIQKAHRHRGVLFADSSYYTLPANAKNAITEATQFSFEMWFYATDAGQVATSNRILFYGNNGNAYVTLTVREPGNSFYFLINDSTNKRIAIATTDYLKSTSYYERSKELKSRILYHVVCKYSGGGVSGMSLYINGKLVPSTGIVQVSTVTPTSMSVNEFHIMGRPTVSASPWRFYGFRLFTKALSDAEVTELYNAGVPKTTTAITSLATELMTFSGDLAVDTAASPLTVSLTGTVTQAYLNEAPSLNLLPSSMLSNGSNEIDLKEMSGGPAFFSLSQQSLSPLAAFQQAGPIVLSDGNKLFYSLNFGGGPGRGYEPFIMQLNTTGAVENFYRSYLDSVNSCDGHEVGTISKGYDGKYIIAKEATRHNDAILFKKTTDWRTFTAGATLGTPGASGFSYPTLTKVGTSRMGLVVRSGNIRLMSGYYSDDSFSTLSAGLTILTLDTPSPVDDNRPYFMLSSNTGGVAEFVIFCTRNNNSEFYMAFAIKTSDMVTFSNLAGTWSKNTSGGMITETELKTNCVIFDETATAGFTRRNSGLCKNSDGKYYIITGDASQNLYLYYQDGTGAWQNKSTGLVTALSAVGNPEITAPVHVSGTTFHLYVIKDVAGQRIPFKYVTTDAFTTFDAGTQLWSGTGNCSQLHLTEANGKRFLLFSIYRDSTYEADLGIYTETI